MRRTPIALVAALAFTAACSDSPTTPAKAVSLAGPSRTLGNGFPQGGHDYRLNIIGVPKDKTASMDNNNGRRIRQRRYHAGRQEQSALEGWRRRPESHLSV